MWDQYEVNGVFDEMFVDRGHPRPHYAAVARRLAKLNPAALDRRRRMADVSFRNQGITFTVYSDPRGVEKTFPFDLVPRIIPADEWETIERGLIQRITALNLFCKDIYHDQRILKEGIIPPELIYGAKMFRREMLGIDVPARRLHAHLRHRPDSRQRGQLPRPGGQRPHAERRELRAGEPRGAEARRADVLRRVPRAQRSRIIRTTCCSA